MHEKWTKLYGLELLPPRPGVSLWATWMKSPACKGTGAARRLHLPWWPALLRGLAAHFQQPDDKILQCNRYSRINADRVIHFNFSFRLRRDVFATRKLHFHRRLFFCSPNVRMMLRLDLAISRKHNALTANFYKGIPDMKNTFKIR